MEAERLIQKMVAYYSGDPKRIQHFIKVYSFASLIGKEEKLEGNIQFILETAAIVHDIGIKAAEMKYQSASGNYQELEGPPIAEKMLTELCYPPDVIERVCYLVGHHHTYNEIDGLDYQILVEADLLVNMYEDEMGVNAINFALNKIFRTKTGIRLCKTIFALDNSN